jgi:GT2 family glycosyltransferase
MTGERKDKDIAVLMACYNRRETTLRALRRLHEQEIPAGYRVRVVFLDDGSTDGTTEAARREFPNMTFLQGDGDYYWIHSMVVAWKAARPADLYFWLNDDTDLVPGAIQQLIDVYEASPDPATIVVGATCDHESGKTCTGGIRRHSWRDVEVMMPGNKPQMCDSINGNIVLVPREAEAKIGTMDDRFTHLFADADYGLRARQAGIPVLLAPGHLGTTELNTLKGSTHDLDTSFRERWKLLFGPKGNRPPKEWWIFVRRHAPRPKALYWAGPYVMCLAEGLLGGKVRLRHRLRRPMERIFE